MGPLQAELVAQLQAHNDLGLEDQRRLWEESHGVRVSTATMSRAIAQTFEAYVEHILAPSLWAGQIVVLDNLSVHKGAKVRQLIQARGGELLFLPAYSPMFYWR